MNYKIFNSREEQADYFTDRFIDTLNSTSKAEFNVALSGGGSPKWYLPALIEWSEINWMKVKLFQVDERCVPVDDEKSNYKMINDVLIKHTPLFNENIFRMKGEIDPKEAAEEYGKFLDVNNIKMDLVIMGMGSDGHTASIFPGEDYLYKYKDITAVTKFPSSEQRRITLTEDYINSSVKKIFIIEGADKEDKLKRIFNKDNHSELPAGRITGDVDWLLNKDCAKFLL